MKITTKDSEMIILENNCFYYGTLRTDGYRSLMCNPEFDSEKTYMFDIHSFALKQQLFGFIKDELERRNIPYTDLCISDGSGGIFCKKFKIIDSDFCEENNENYPRIFSEKDKENNVENMLVEREKNLLRAQRYITVCNCVNDDIFRLTERYINKSKINICTSRLWRRISKGMKGQIGTEKKRYVTCLTADGVELNMEAFDIYCENILVIKDKTGVCAKLITDRIRSYALSSGYDIICCPCAVNENIIEHIIIPELQFGIFTSKYYHHAEFENCKTVYAKQFMLSNVENIKNRIDFSLKAYRNLMNEVFTSLERINKCNRIIDREYLNGFDFEQAKAEILSLLF